MVYYKDNPNLSLKTVKTVKGDIEYRKNTKYISEKYYTIDRDCIKINDKHYSLDSDNIYYDSELKTYGLRGRMPITLMRGLVFTNDRIEMGFFTANPYTNVTTNSNKFGRIMAINSEILEKNGWVEDKSDNWWYLIEEQSSATLSTRKRIRNRAGVTNRAYNIEDNMDFPKKVELYEKYPTHITPKAKEISKYLGDLTFGIEVELRAGNLPDSFKNRLGIVECRDGSLNGGSELVSVVLQGAKGLQTVVDLSDALKTRGMINLDCSFHIHFGNMKKDKLSVIALYRLCRSVQNDLFSMFPYYKTDPAGYKQKNYTKKLMKLNIHALKDNSKEAYEFYIADSWNKLFNFYSEGLITQAQFNKKTRAHPLERKWERKSRYCFMNFLNLFFGHRHTMESRLSSGTINKHKMINWLLINVAIIKYAERHTMEIISSDKTISLKEILDIFPTLFPTDKKAHFISKYLYEYFLQRQTRCKKDLDKDDYLSEWDITEDTDYEFSYQDVKGLI